MDIKKYLEEKIEEFGDNLALISKCRKEEMSKPYKKRDYQLLYMFHKDEALYNFCLEEFRALLTCIS